MQKGKRGLAAALLLFICCAGGCRKPDGVYHAGVQTEARQTAGEQLLIGEETGASLSADDTQSEASLPAKPAQDKAVQGASTAVEEADLPDTADQTGTDGITGYVHICGAVNAPGVYPIRSGMRLFEAVELAGGFAPEADEVWLNQAQLVQDGQRWYIYTREETQELEKARTDSTGSMQDAAVGQFVQSPLGGGQNGQSGVQNPAETMQSAQNSAQEEKVNLNTADKETLMTLPGIGESRAEAIMQYRSDQGGFSTIEEIQEISGIKNAVYSKIKDRITV